MSKIKVFLFEAATALALLLSTLNGAAQNPVPSGFNNVSTTWKASPVTTDCDGFLDQSGHPWTDPLFDDSAWSAITPPDNGNFNGVADRFYRGKFTLSSTIGPISLFFVSDDGIEVFVNGTSLGSFHPFSPHICHVLGCVNIPGCGPGFNLNAAPVQVPANLLRQGTNVVTAHVSNGGGGSYFDMAVLTPTISQSNGCQVSLPLPPLPYYQFDPPWNTNIYADYSPTAIFPAMCPISKHATIQCLGCALTALSMALYQAGITDVPPTSTIPNDPGSLNTFMQSHAGDFDPGEVVDFVNTTLDISNARGISQGKALTFDYTFGNSTSSPDLFKAVCTQNPSGPVPVIVKVTGTSADHFVLVTGAETQSDGSTKFSILDPGHADKTTLDAYNNQFKIIGSVKDPLGDNSTLSLSVGGNGDLLVIDPTGKRTGFDPIAGTVVEEVTGSIYERDALGSDEAAGVPAETAHSVHLRQLQDGNYTATITGLNLGEFTLIIRAFSQDASAQLPLLLQGVAGTGSISTFSLQFSPVPGTTATATRVATIQSTSADISNSLQLGLINNQGVANSLLQKLEAVANAASRDQSQTKANVLNAFKNEVNAQSGKHISGVAVQILLQDADSLLRE